MKIFETILMTVACTLFLVASASAGEIFSPPVFVDHNQVVECDIAYIGNQASRDVHWDIVDPSGDAGGGTGNNTIGPGQIAGGGSGGSQIYGLYYCHFTFDGKIEHYRAAIKLRNITGTSPNTQVSGDIVALPAY
jgi:hypothetical protein